MSGLDKILEHIEASATDTAKELISNAEAEAAKAAEAGRESAALKEASIVKQAEADVAAAAKRIQSAADQKEKRMILEAKQNEINSVIEAASEQLKNMGDEEYFGTILKMVSRYAQKRDGSIQFAQKDLDRLPEGFAAKLNEVLGGNGTLAVSDKAARIDGGFILKYGDVEENCSFDALIEASREDLQDKIGQILFN